ncbi:hypothetical protein [Burkholderia sp. Ch1-1]|uniref:hypothetical protein n=1 Tax=Paraburkholderia sp. DGU8 TaxID=3161997 RepID=UPI0001D214CF|nr:hypothetical protein BCh11DRAFT_00247 [Burkholderia sp. Ch1-1]
MIQNDTVASVVKVAPPVAVSAIQAITESLPSFVLWVTAIYTVLQLYVLIRDKILRHEEGGDEQF